MDYNWITTNELSQILDISTSAIRQNIRKGKYQVRKVCKWYEIFIPSLDIEVQNKIKVQKEKASNSLKNIQYSEEAKKLALTKFDLVMQWRSFTINYKGGKVESVKDFMKIYDLHYKNSQAYIKINNVSPSTMFRWNKKLKDCNDNWQVLLNKYKGYSKCTQLSDVEKEVFLKFLLHPNQTNIGKAIKLTKYVLREKGMTDFCCDMTYRRFARKYIAEHYDLWVFSREGGKALKDKVVPYIERDISQLEVGEVIIGDGHKLAFQVINPFDGKLCRPTLVAYQDWKSGAIVGFEIMLEENTQCIASALRNSIINLGKIPKYVYQDNGKAFKADYFTNLGGITGLFVKLGITPIFAQPYNAKAKPIERLFREMQDSFERLLPSFVGSCIDNQPAYLKRNEKIHKKCHSNYVPTIEQVIKLLNYWLSFHYSMPCKNVEGKTIGEVLEGGKGNGVDVSELDDLMMVTEIKRIGRNGIRFLKSDYYDESLYGLRIKVVIKYSLFDLSEIKVYDTNGKFICIAKRMEAMNPLANYTGDAKDIEEFKQRIKQQKRLEQQTVKAYFAELKKDKIDIPLLEEKDYKEYNSIDDKKLYLSEFKDFEEENTPPKFHNRYEKYDYLKKKSKLTKDEEIWINQYEQSDEFQLIYCAEGRY